MPGMNSLDVSLWQPAARYPSTKSVTIRRLSKSSCCVFFRRRRLNRSAPKVGHSTFYGKTGKRDKPPFLVPHQSERWPIRRVPKTGALHAICRASGWMLGNRVDFPKEQDLRRQQSISTYGPERLCTCRLVKPACLEVAWPPPHPSATILSARPAWPSPSWRSAACRPCCPAFATRPPTLAVGSSPRWQQRPSRRLVIHPPT